MSVLRQKIGLLGFSLKPLLLLFVLSMTCVACDKSKDFLMRAERSGEKAVYMDSLFAMNSQPAEFVKATDDRMMFYAKPSADLMKAFDLLKKDDANYSPEQAWRVDLSWREVNDSICFYYCNKGKDAVLWVDSLGANVFPTEGLKWILDQEEVKSRINNSLFDPTRNPFPVLDLLEKTRYLAFVNNDCVIYPYALSAPGSSFFNSGSARLSVKLFDLTDRSYQPFATLSVFAKNSRTISVSETEHQYNGKTLFKSTNASDRVKEDLSNNIIVELKWAIYHALISAKKTTD